MEPPSPPHPTSPHPAWPALPAARPARAPPRAPPAPSPRRGPALSAPRSGRSRPRRPPAGRAAGTAPSPPARRGEGGKERWGRPPPAASRGVLCSDGGRQRSRSRSALLRSLPRRGTPASGVGKRPPPARFHLPAAGGLRCPGGPRRQEPGCCSERAPASRPPATRAAPTCPRVSVSLRVGGVWSSSFSLYYCQFHFPCPLFLLIQCVVFD